MNVTTYQKIDISEFTHAMLHTVILELPMSNIDKVSFEKYEKLIYYVPVYSWIVASQK